MASSEAPPEAPDPEFMQQRLFGTYGPIIHPPSGFSAPRICGGCGVVYYPKESRQIDGSAAKG